MKENIKKSPLSALFLAGSALWPAVGSADNSAIRIPAISAFGEVGYFTYKSELAESNDTGLRYSYGFQMFGGDDRNLGAGMRHRQRGGLVGKSVGPARPRVGPHRIRLHVDNH